MRPLFAWATGTAETAAGVSPAHARCMSGFRPTCKAGPVLVHRARPDRTGRPALRFAETRSISNLTEHRLTWEEYRYDPLGRRILVRERNWCDYVTNRQECSFNTIRRTVWDGDQVLYEIQMEDSDLSRENDTERSTADHMPPSIFDPNVLVGRVLLTHGPGMDQPLSVIRMRYVQEEVLDWPHFAVIPIWNSQGRAPYVMFSNGQRTLAHPAHPTIKLGTWWLLAKEAYGPANNAVVTSPSGYDQVWLGSVMEDQQDASGLLYRRNRYYDPATGRFTQEDPIGLAGGLNLYGFAAGDPVTYSDPFGLRIIIQGDRAYRRRVRSALEYMAQNSESFARVYEALLSPDVTVTISNTGVPNCRSVHKSCTRREGENGAHIQFTSGYSDEYVQAQYGFALGEGDWFIGDGWVLAHEVFHAGGILAQKVNTGVEAVCGATGTKAAETCAKTHEETVIRELNQ